MTIIRHLYRWPLFILLLLSGAILTILFLRKSTPTRGFTSWIITTWLGAIARVFGARIKSFGNPLTEKNLFVSNHISWLDIMVIGHLVPVHFLAKMEVKHMPVFGWFASRAGTLYLHRGNHESASEATIEICNALTKNQNSLVFAEGTTTDGNIKRFHGRLLQSAIDAHAHVQPVAIFYPKYNPDTGKTELNPAIRFINDDTIGESANLIVREPSIDVEVHFLDPIECRDRSRDELAQHAYNEVIKVIDDIKNRQG